MRTGYHVTSSARFRRATRSGGRTHRRSRHVTNARPYHRRHGDAACPHNNFSTSPIRRIQSAVSPLGGANENNLLVGDKGVRSMIWRELLDTVKARKLAYYGHTMRKQGSCLEKEIMQGTIRCTQARKATHGPDGQHQDVDRTIHGRVNQNDRGQG